MKLLLAAFTLVAFNAFAQEDLNSMKRMANDHISSKMSSLETAKTCIDGAKTKDAFKACKYDMHKEMKMQKMEMKEKKKEKMEESEVVE